MRKNNELAIQLTLLRQEKDEIREELDIETNEFNPYRKRLIKKGIINGEQRGIVEFTLPMFEDYVMENS